MSDQKPTGRPAQSIPFLPKAVRLASRTGKTISSKRIHPTSRDTQPPSNAVAQRSGLARAVRGLEPEGSPLW
jgi:hypothetical protein